MTNKTANRANRADRDCAVILENAQSQYTENTVEQKKQGSQHLFWCFTFNNYTEEQIEQIEMILRVEADWYVFQEEEGENKTPHLQGTFKLKNRKRLTELKRLITGDPHLEPTKKIPASIVYCCDHNKRVNNGRLFSMNVELPEIADPIEVDEPYGWQLNIMDILDKKPDKRTIHWFYSLCGKVGKSSLAKYLVVKRQAIMVSGKSQDMFSALRNAKSRKIIIIDAPKSTQDFINYGAIEQIKNGLVFSGKYESCQLVFNCPHVIVFANEPPDTSKMSLDRWNIVNILEIMK